MRVLDLFAGNGGWSQAFSDHGHDVWRVDNNEYFEPDILANVARLLPRDLPHHIDVVLASPPCQYFSIASVRHHWRDGKPVNMFTEEAIRLVEHTVWLIERLDPQFWVVENPRGMLRKLDLIPGDHHCITLCQYGSFRQKPTDLWGRFPPSWQPKPMCKAGAPCHEAAPRGRSAGTQGYWANQPHLSAQLPYLLSLDLCEACEADLR